MHDNLSFSDAHCHLEMFRDPFQVVEDARKKGVGLIITAGSDATSNLKMLELSKGTVYGVAGIDPEFASVDFRYIDELAELIRMNRNIIGIGEIGIDSTKTGKASIEKQIEAFEKQIDIAKEMEMPIVVHSRKALEKVMEILERKEVEKAVMHFFEGTEEQARILAKKGYLISIPPGESGKRKRVIKTIELNSIVAETDSPAAGESPADVVKVIELIASLKGINPEEAGEAITKTIKDYFYI